MTNDQIIAKAITEALSIVKHECVRTLSYLGEQCVKVARDRPMSESWTDRTGNLRSSIGYVVAYEGQTAAASSFETTPATRPLEKGESANGAKIGRAFAQELAEKHTEPCLVVVAGMEYAPYVEAKGYDVLTSAELHAKSKIDEYLEKTKDRINKQLEQL